MGLSSQKRSALITYGIQDPLYCVSNEQGRAGRWPLIRSRLWAGPLGGTGSAYKEFCTRTWPYLSITKSTLHLHPDKTSYPRRLELLYIDLNCPNSVHHHSHVMKRWAMSYEQSLSKRWKMKCWELPLYDNPRYGCYASYDSNLASWKRFLCYLIFQLALRGRWAYTIHCSYK